MYIAQSEPVAINYATICWQLAVCQLWQSYIFLCNRHSTFDNYLQFNLIFFCCSKSWGSCLSCYVCQLCDVSYFCRKSEPLNIRNSKLMRLANESHESGQLLFIIDLNNCIENVSKIQVRLLSKKASI